MICYVWLTLYRKGTRIHYPWVLWVSNSFTYIQSSLKFEEGRRIQSLALRYFCCRGYLPIGICDLLSMLFTISETVKSKRKHGRVANPIKSQELPRRCLDWISDIELSEKSSIGCPFRHSGDSGPTPIRISDVTCVQRQLGFRPCPNWRFRHETCPILTVSRFQRSSTFPTEHARNFDSKSGSIMTIRNTLTICIERKSRGCLMSIATLKLRSKI
jgi:hypothetical protein